jgi:hypothetical protein
LSAGTALHAPKPTPMITLTNDEVGWKAAVAWRPFDDEDAPKA